MSAAVRRKYTDFLFKSLKKASLWAADTSTVDDYTDLKKAQDLEKQVPGLVEANRRLLEVGADATKPIKAGPDTADRKGAKAGDDVPGLKAILPLGAYAVLLEDAIHRRYSGGAAEEGYRDHMITLLRHITIDQDAIARAEREVRRAAEAQELFSSALDTKKKKKAHKYSDIISPEQHRQKYESAIAGLREPLMFIAEVAALIPPQDLAQRTRSDELVSQRQRQALVAQSNARAQQMLLTDAHRAGVRYCDRCQRVLPETINMNGRSSLDDEECGKQAELLYEDICQCRFDTDAEKEKEPYKDETESPDTSATAIGAKRPRE